MRKAGHAFIHSQAARRVATYGKTLRTHSQLVALYGLKQPSPSAACVDELTLLEEVERRMRSWRLNKWEFRVPVLLGEAEKERCMQQLDILKAMVLEQSKLQEAVDDDMALVCRELKVTADELRQKTRAWLQEKVSELRWKGEVNTAKAVRDAFVRLEGSGSRDFRFFERLCTVYGLARVGTFDEAFMNYIVEDRSKPSGARLDTENPFPALVQCILSKYPQLEIIYHFLGMNPQGGYRSALWQYVCEALAFKHETAVPDTRSRVVGFKPKGERNGVELFF